MLTTDAIKNFYANAPRNAPANPDIRGWWVPVEGGVAYLSNQAAACIMARGCSLPGAAPVWLDQPEPHGVCCCTE